MKKWLLLLFALLPINAYAAETSICVQGQSPFGGQTCIPVTSSSPLPVTGGGGSTTGGQSIYSINNATNTVYSIKSSAGNLSWISFDNVANPAVETCIQFFDLATANVTLGSTTPKFAVCAPAGGYWDTPLALPAQFTTAISYAVTTTRTGNTAPGSAITVRFGYF